MMTDRGFLVLGALLAGLTVGIGAFGAHGLAGVLQANGREGTFETGVRYSMYHAFALILVGLLMRMGGDAGLLRWSGWLFFFGIVVFGGSLYVLSLTNMRWLGAVTPLGGLCFLAGWGVLAWGVWKG